MKNVEKNEKGIAMITLVITVLLIIIITSALAKNSYDSLQVGNLTKLDNDIKALNDRIAAYYIQYAKLPTYGEKYDKETIKNDINDLSPNDGDEYYIIDLSELDNLTLNYGENYLTSSNDLYIINEQSHVVYYLRGIKYKGQEYHTVGKQTSVFLNY
ncbi:MAG: hypothetical protein HFJ54_02365 [Clostridia bacterium]|nr:hypothetical protein [Clostridia bacterium]